MSDSEQPYRILFVCMGNICRSPMAKWIMQDLCEQHGVTDRFQIDSCGTGAWHAGEAADPRSAQCGEKYGLDVTHTARQIRRADFEYFDLLLVMDQTNLRDVKAMMPHGSNIRLLRSFDPQLANVPADRLDVPDPYYGGEQGFEMMYQMLTQACAGLFDSLRKGT